MGKGEGFGSSRRNLESLLIFRLFFVFDIWLSHWSFLANLWPQKDLQRNFRKKGILFLSFLYFFKNFNPYCTLCWPLLYFGKITLSLWNKRGFSHWVDFQDGTIKIYFAHNHLLVFDIPEWFFLFQNLQKNWRENRYWLFLKRGKDFFFGNNALYSHRRIFSRPVGPNLCRGWLLLFAPKISFSIIFHFLPLDFIEKKEFLAKIKLWGSI